jgi:uncharacterized protein (DUF433 family)
MSIPNKVGVSQHVFDSSPILSHVDTEALSGRLILAKCILSNVGTECAPGVPMREIDLLARITIDPEQCGGRPCIRGMRVRVVDVLQLLAAGETPQEILAEYPYLEPDDIAASLLYAARQLDHPVLAA